MGESEYRTLGLVYVMLGVWFSVNFLLNRAVNFMLFSGLILGPMGAYFGFILLFVLFLSIVVGSFVFVVFGVVLLFRGGVWVARVSGFLFVFLLLSYIIVLFIPFVVVSGQ
ncbi:MAG: hypothetical protein ACTSSC_11765 [Promethearchaeota archaeon]